MILNNFEVVGIVCMWRENILPVADIKWDKHEIDLFNLHFKNRQIVENDKFGSFNAKEYKKKCKTIYVDPTELNSEKVYTFIKELEFDLTVVFGADIIKDPILSYLPKYKINIHLGISPWYKGAATLFWPFYFLEPNMAGATIHLIAPKADAGEIIHHSLPMLDINDKIHDVGAKVVIKAADDIIRILQKLSCGIELPVHEQKSSGKLFLERDFRPEHLRLIYDLYDDNIVKYYLENIFTYNKQKSLILGV
jgi:methionyl-tRNA formyltransferase